MRVNVDSLDASSGDHDLPASGWSLLVLLRYGPRRPHQVAATEDNSRGALQKISPIRHAVECIRPFDAIVRLYNE
jgi:hypothetical protein